MKHPRERIAIVNHGVAALRLIRAVRELNREQRLSLATVALFTEPDRHAKFVREADDVISLGPATFLDQRDGQSKSSYQHRERIEEALLAAQASAVWPGWGLQAREFWLADLCERLGITFIGPDAGVLQLLGDRISVKQLAQQANIPVVPWSGRGIEGGYQLEVQIVADQYGTTWAIDVCKCTLALTASGYSRNPALLCCHRRRSASYANWLFGCASLQATGMPGVWSSCTTPASTHSGS